jgi:hypothetical protein
VSLSTSPVVRYWPEPRSQARSSTRRSLSVTSARSLSRRVASDRWSNVAAPPLAASLSLHRQPNQKS